MFIDQQGMPCLRKRLTIAHVWSRYAPCSTENYRQNYIREQAACSGGRIVSWIIYCWLVWCERKTLFPAENLRSFTSKRTGCQGSMQVWNRRNLHPQTFWKSRTRILFPSSTRTTGWSLTLSDVAQWRPPTSVTPRILFPSLLAASAPASDHVSGRAR